MASGWLGGGGSELGAATWPIAVAAGVLFLSLLREHFDFYWVILLPALAGSAAVGTAEAIALLSRILPSAAWAAALLPLLLLPAWAVRHHGNSAWPEERQKAGTVKRFPWIPSAPYADLDPLTASFFFKPYRIQGELEPSVYHYLWSKKRFFSTATEIASAVRASTPGGSTLTGASTSAPLIALLAGRRMAADEVDTNSKVFKTGMRDRADFWRRACDDDLAAILAAPRSFFSARKLAKMPSIRRDFTLNKVIEDPWLLHFRPATFHLFTRRSGHARCQAP